MLLETLFIAHNIKMYLIYMDLGIGESIEVIYRLHKIEK